MPWIVFAIGSAVLFLGWFGGVEWLRSPNPAYFPSMRPATALCLMFAGLQLAAMRKRLWSQTAMAAGCIFGVLLAFVLPSWQESIDQYDWNDSASAISAAVPSIATCIVLALVANVGVVESMWQGYRWVLRYWTGGAVLAIAASSLLGFLFNEPSLFSFVPGVSTGVSPQSTLCYVIIGLCLINNRK